MRRFLYSLLLTVLISNCAFTQEREKSFFSIEGKVNLDTGTVNLRPVVDSEWYPQDLTATTARISNGKFVLKGEITNPLGVYIEIQDVYYSPTYILSEGDQSVKIDINHNNEFVGYKSRYDQEEQAYRSYFLRSKQHIPDYYQVRDSLEAKGKISGKDSLMLEKLLVLNYRNTDSTMLSYVQENPKSAVAFWHFAELSRFGFSPIFDTIYRSFDKNIRRSFTGKKLKEYLAISGRMGKGKTLPKLVANDPSGVPIKANFYKSHEYTLVDFWYSSCGPCIAQFPKLKELYNEYSHLGFNIIGISTDRSEDIPQWRSAIKKFVLPWRQFIDENAVFSESIGIAVYPSSYLIDRTGKIILVNVKPNLLEDFLENRLHK